MDQDLSNKVVLLRTDFNVPTKNNKISDFTRINESIPTIKALIEKKATILIITHRGRPNGKIDTELSMAPIAIEVEKILKKPIEFIDRIGQKVKNNPKKIFMLENIRFHAEEEENELNFAKELSKMADIYINDAFSVSHRAHSSLCGITFEPGLVDSPPISIISAPEFIIDFILFNALLFLLYKPPSEKLSGVIFKIPIIVVWLNNFLFNEIFLISK